MRRGIWPLTLSRRIVVSVAAGLAFVLLVFSLLTIWTIREATQASYSERVALAQMLGRHVDNVLLHALETLSHGASELVINPLAPSADRQWQSLTALQPPTGDFALRALTTTDGVLVWSDRSWPGLQVGRPMPGDGVELALREGQPQIAELDSPGDAENPFPALVAPITDPEGRLVGTLIALFDPGRGTIDLLHSNDLGSGLRVQLVSRSGKLIASAPPNAPSVLSGHHELLAAIMDQGEPGYRIHEPSKAEGFGSHLVAYAPVSSMPSWGILVEQPKDAVVEVPRRLQFQLGFFGLGALVLAACVSWFDVRRVVRPLKRLTAAAERFAAGNLEEPVGLNRSDELGILARSFETMRQRLRTSLDEVAQWNRELERRVAARTQEVEERNRELARLYENLRQRERERAELLRRLMAGQEEERRLLAQELHDEASQALTSLRLGLERLAAGREDVGQTKKLAAGLQDVASHTLADLHRMAVELRPSVLDDVGLVAAIEHYLKELVQRTEVKVDFVPVGMDGFRLIPAAELAIYRIVQAAITNIVSHSQARHVSVLLERRGDRLVIVVEDDGRGFDIDAVRASELEHRLGLAGMEERASAIGAKLTLESAPGQGTTVFLDVPVDVNSQVSEPDAQTADTSR